MRLALWIVWTENARPPLCAFYTNLLPSWNLTDLPIHLPDRNESRVLTFPYSENYLIERNSQRMTSVTFRRRLTLGFGLAGMLLTLLAGCGGGGSGSTSSGGSTSGLGPEGSFVTPGTTPYVLSTMASRSACSVNSHVNGRARWTVLVYMNAASNLQPFSLINVAQMCSVGSNANLNIVLQWKQTATSNYFSSVPVDTTPSFVGTRRYLLPKLSTAQQQQIAPTGIDTNPNLVGNTTVLDPYRLPDPSTNTVNDNGTMTSDMGLYTTLQNFVQWGAKAYPADNMILVIWDHGSAMLNVDNRSVLHNKKVPKTTRAVASSSKILRGLSQDTQTGNQIATWQLNLALANPPQPIDAVVIDCSLQGGTEMAYQLKNSARILIASEDSPPGLGLPYDTWLNYVQSATGSVCDIGSNLINDDIAQYASGGYSDITQSMTDLSKMAPVGTALNNFGSTLNKYVTSLASTIMTDRQAAQYFDFPEYKDLYDFTDIVRRSSGAPSDLVTAAGNLESALISSNGAILMSAHGTYTDNTGFNEDGASGLSIFLPGPNEQSSVDSTVGFDPQWNQLAIATAAPNWATFLQNQTE